MFSYFLCLLFLGLANAGPLEFNSTKLFDDDVFQQFKVEMQEAHKLSDEGDDTIITAIINKYSDKVLVNIDHFMAKQKFDPMAMPDISQKFQKYMMNGEFTLSAGILTDASTLHRDGTCSISYNKSAEMLTMIIPLAFTDLKFKYDYRVKYMKIGPTGLADGAVTNLRMKVILTADMNTYLFKLNDYEIISAGKMYLNFHGNMVYDWLLDLMTESTTIALKPIILSLVEIIVEGTLKHLVDTINTLVQEFLGSDGLMLLNSSSLL